MTAKTLLVLLLVGSALVAAPTASAASLDGLTPAPALDADLPADAARCVGLPCDVINAVCWIALKTWCVG